MEGDGNAPTPLRPPASTTVPAARAWLRYRQALTANLSDLLLFLMLVVQWTTSNQVISSWLAVFWLLCSLALDGSGEAPRWRAGQWPLLLILILNLRGLVFQEGTQPVSHMDYIIIIAAFVAGMGRDASRWIHSFTAIFAAAIAGAVLNLNPILRSLRAIFSGTADVSGWYGQTWAGQYLRVGEMSVNQTAFLVGLTLSLSLAVVWHGRGAARRLAAPTVVLMVPLAFATGSRLALLLPPLAVIAGAVVVRPQRRARRQGPVPAGLALVIGAALVALLGPGRQWLLQSYASRKLAGDLGRLEVLSCYGSLPFSGEARWALGVGYGEAWKRFCDEDVGIHVSHAHNLFAQLMAETGLLATVAVLVGLVLVWRPLLWPGRGPDPAAAAGAAAGDCMLIQRAFVASFVYIILFSMFELAFLKITALECLAGYLLSLSFCRQPLLRRV